jgi:hypothetical protein
LSQVATAIATTLGYLAIAIAQAGSAIRAGLCEFSGYLAYYERQWKKTRQNRQTIKSKDTGDELRVYTTFDLNIRAMMSRETEATRDALQLLNTFAFLVRYALNQANARQRLTSHTVIQNRQNIRFDILKRSITNAELERQHGGKEAASRSATAPASWSKTWKSVMVHILASKCLGGQELTVRASIRLLSLPS